MTPPPTTTMNNDEEEVNTTTPRIPPMFANNPRIKALFEQRQQNIDATSSTNQNNQLTQDELFALLQSEALISALHDPDLQQIITTINNAPHHDWQILFLRHQIEFNVSFATFVEGLLTLLQKRKQQQNGHDDSIPPIDEQILEKLAEIFTNP